MTCLHQQNIRITSLQTILTTTPIYLTNHFCARVALSFLERDRIVKSMFHWVFSWKYNLEEKIKHTHTHTHTHDASRNGLATFFSLGIPQTRLRGTSAAPAWQTASHKQPPVVFQGCVWGGHNRRFGPGAYLMSRGPRSGEHLPADGRGSRS